MYLRNKLIAGLKIKNVLFAVFGIFDIVFSIMDIISLWVQYGDEPETVYNAVSYNESKIAIVVGMIMVLICILSRKLIGDANMYNSYFELDLDGYITYEELAQVTGKSTFTVMFDMYLIMNIYMKRYRIGSDGKHERIELYSKTSKCYCTSCGAPLDKKIYFTGICSYCGSSDLFAGVISDGRYYNITSDFGKEKRTPSFYRGKHYVAKLSGIMMGVCFNAASVFISIIVIIDSISKYNDEEYLKKAIFEIPHAYSFELVRHELLETIYAFLVIFVGTLIASVIFCKRFGSILATRNLSDAFVKVKKPIVPISQLNRTLGTKAKVKKTRKKMKIALRRGYLRNATLEYHNRTIEVALAKKIVKDRCPSCGASIVGAADLNYICTYCGNKIMDVVVKK